MFRYLLFSFGSVSSIGGLQSDFRSRATPSTVLFLVNGDARHFRCKQRFRGHGRRPEPGRRPSSENEQRRRRAEDSNSQICTGTWNEGRTIPKRLSLLFRWTSSHVAWTLCNYAGVSQKSRGSVQFETAVG